MSNRPCASKQKTSMLLLTSIFLAAVMSRPYFPVLCLPLQASPLLFILSMLYTGSMCDNGEAKLRSPFLPVEKNSLSVSHSMGFSYPHSIDTASLWLSSRCGGSRIFPTGRCFVPHSTDIQLPCVTSHHSIFSSIIRLIEPIFSLRFISMKDTLECYRNIHCHCSLSHRPTRIIGIGYSKVSNVPLNSPSATPGTRATYLWGEPVTKFDSEPSTLLLYLFHTCGNCRCT
jgi:hypothetical protein